MRLPLVSGSRLRPLAAMPCAGLTEPLDQRIESFLADILAVAGEDLDAIARWVRVALADCEEIFRAQETNRLFRDDGDPYRVSRGVTPAGGVPPFGFARCFSADRPVHGWPSGRQARSISYRIGGAKFPVLKDLDTFVFADTPIDEGQLRELATGTFPDASSTWSF